MFTFIGEFSRSPLPVFISGILPPPLTAARLTGVNRGTVGNLALRVGLGCQEMHDHLMVGVRPDRLELDEAWSFVGKKQKNVKRHEIHAKGDQYIFIAMAGTQKAIISWGVGKRNMESTMDFLHDLRGRVIGQPEIPISAS